MSKKALTPLISTVLLLIFAIGLGTLVISWGSGEGFSEKGCEDTRIGVTKLNYQSKICIGEAGIEAIIENNGKTDVETIKVVMLGGEVTSNVIEEKIFAGEYKKLNIPVSLESIEKVRLIPYAGTEICSSRRVEIENINRCE